MKYKLFCYNIKPFADMPAYAYNVMTMSYFDACMCENLQYSKVSSPCHIIVDIDNTTDMDTIVAIVRKELEHVLGVKLKAFSFSDVIERRTADEKQN